MKNTRIKILPFKRKRQNKTDYRLRLRLLTSQKPRLVIRKSLAAVRGQLIAYEAKGDRVLATAESKELKGYGWEGAVRNTPSAYLTGYLLGLKAKKKNIKEAIIDIGLYRATKGNILFALAKGVIDAGISIPLSDTILPKEERLKGKHLKQNQFDKVFQALKLKVKE